MFNFIMLIVAIYVALIAAAVTIATIAMSSWYIKKCNKMSEKWVNEMFNNDK